jgi:Mg2+ and Co2+ transporter CorA
VIALPMTIVTSFFGMNFDDERVGGWGWLLNNPTGFWLSMLFIAATVFGLLALFRRRRWL